MFDTLHTSDSRLLVAVTRALALVAGLVVPTALCSGYRAWVQVRTLDLSVASTTLRPGSVIDAAVVTSGRTFVDLRVELVQDGEAATLAEQHLDDNAWSSVDPRPVRGARHIVLSAADLVGFHGGDAVVRATATGRHQFLRRPPPTVREVGVRIERE